MFEKCLERVRILKSFNIPEDEILKIIKFDYDFVDTFDNLSDFDIFLHHQIKKEHIDIVNDIETVTIVEEINLEDILDEKSLIVESFSGTMMSLYYKNGKLDKVYPIHQNDIEGILNDLVENMDAVIYGQVVKKDKHKYFIANDICVLNFTKTFENIV